jgi:hypothetical protein
MSNLTRFGILLGGAFLAWGLWLGEVCWIKGWTGLAWLSGFNWSALPICALVAIESAYLLGARSPWPRRIKFVGVGFVWMMAAFLAGRWAAFEMFSGPTTPRHSLPAVLVVAIALVVVSVGLTVAANRWLSPLHAWTGIPVAAALLLVVPLSLVTIQVIPALNGSSDAVHSVKMGYPVFWTALLVPLALRLGQGSRPPQ